MYPTTKLNALIYEFQRRTEEEKVVVKKKKKLRKKRVVKRKLEKKPENPIHVVISAKK